MKCTNSPRLSQGDGVVGVLGEIADGRRERLSSVQRSAFASHELQIHQVASRGHDLALCLCRAADGLQDLDGMVARGAARTRGGAELDEPLE